VYAGYLYVLSLFGQLPDSCHGRIHLPFVTINDTYGNCRTLPLVLKTDLGNGGIESGTQAVFQTAYDAALVLQGLRLGNYQIDGK